MTRNVAEVSLLYLQTKLWTIKGLWGGTPFFFFFFFGRCGTTGFQTQGLGNKFSLERKMRGLGNKHLKLGKFAFWELKFWPKQGYLSIFAPCPKGCWLHEQNQPIYSYPQHSYSLEEGAASNDIIFPSLPWSSLSVGTRDHFHKNTFGKMHVAHSTNMIKPGQLWFSDVSKDPLGFKFAGGNS